MTLAVPDYEDALAAAIHDFWMIETNQHAVADLLGRNLATGGAVRARKHMSQFEVLTRKVVEDSGIERDPAPSDTMLLPSFYRETKSWDVVLQFKEHPRRHGGQVAGVEPGQQLQHPRRGSHRPGSRRVDAPRVRPADLRHATVDRLPHDR